MYTFKLEINASDIDNSIINNFRDGTYSVLVIRDADQQTVNQFGSLLPQDMYGKTEITIGLEDEQGEKLDHAVDMLWHQDRAYHKDVHQFVGLYCIHADVGSSPTYFADMQSIFKTSPSSLQALARGVECVNSITKYMDQEEYPYEFKSEAHKRAYRMKNKATHPLVKEDAHGEYYFFSEAYTETDLSVVLQRQVDLSDDKYLHNWQPNDLLVYNNYKVIHRRDKTNTNVRRQHIRYALR